MRIIRALVCSLVTLAAMRSLADSTFVVNSPADAADASLGDGNCQTATPGICTLRAAIQEANALAGPDVIQVPAMTITLSLGELYVSSPITIQGAGRLSTVLSANLQSRVFDVYHGNLTLSRLTVRDGNAGNGNGGCIAIDLGIGGAVAVDDCLIVHCYASSGGGIHSFTSEFPDVRGSREPLSGAFQPFEPTQGVQEPPLSITRSLINDCHASNDGGGLKLLNHAIVRSTTLDENTAVAGGGAISTGTDGILYLLNCTVSGNTASGPGGGILLTAGSVTLYNSTVAFNLAEEALGGGISAFSPYTTYLLHSIVAYNERSFGVLLLPDDCAGQVASYYKSLVLDVPAHCTATGQLTSVNPMLGYPLKDNGGYNLTHALLPGSPAIGGGTAGGCPSFEGYVLVDQRGVQRPPGAACDLGAYQVSPCGDVNGDRVVNVGDILFFINFLFAGGPVPPGLANVNQDNERSVPDALYLINFLFAGGPAPVCPGT